MNKRQKKKWIKKNMFQIKKMKFNEDDIVFFVFDSDYIDIDTVVKVYNCCYEAGIFDKCRAAILPCDIKKMDVDTAQIYIDKIQEEIDRVKNKNI